MTAKSKAGHKRTAVKKTAARVRGGKQKKNARADWTEHQRQLSRLLDIMRRLRDPQDGCPWDREQTISSLKPYLIEESYEALDAMESGDRKHLEEELGDVLLQIVFQSQIASEEGDFSFADVARGISEKLERRHPHIFGNVKVRNADEVIQNWEAIKKTEKGNQRKSVMDGVPKHAPVLHKAAQIQKKAARVGFDWDDKSDMLKKMDEEIGEFKEAIASGNRAHMMAELGDVLFSIVKVSRAIKCDAEAALMQTINKFDRRFRTVETTLENQGRKIKDCTLADMEEIWDRLRADEKKKPAAKRRKTAKA